MGRMATAIETAWYRKPGWLWLLLPLSLLYVMLTFLRRGLYRAGLFKSWRAPVPVIVVGNIVVGGSGKTPVVLALAEALVALGYKPGIISRGYGAQPPELPYHVEAISPASASGDEPLLLARRSGRPCYIDPQRVRAAQALLELETCDLLLSDDGLQHYALERDIEIAVVSSERGLGNAQRLPVGPLRESSARLREVDFVVGGTTEYPGHEVKLKPIAWVSVQDPDERREVDVFAGQRANCIAGIGNPHSFFTLCQELGVDVIEHALADHEPEIDQVLAALPAEPGLVLMTEKDAVKCADMTAGQYWYLEVVAELPQALVDALAARLDNLNASGTN